MADQDDIRRQARETAGIVEDALRDISSKIKDIFEQSFTSTDTFTNTLKKDITQSLNTLAKTSTLIEGNLSKLKQGNLSRLEIEKQIEQRKIKIATIEAQIAIATRNQLVDGEEILQQLGESKQIEEELTNELRSQADVADKINQKLGNTGKILKGFTKIPILGQLIDSEKVLKKVQQESAKEGSTKTSVFKSGLKETGKTIKESLLDPTVLMGGTFTALVKIAQFFVDAMFAADKQVTDIAKNFNISKDSARGTRDAFTEIADSAGNFAKIQEGNLLLQKEIVDANIQINNLLGTSVDLSKTRNQEGADFVTQFANATKFLALSDEEQKGLLDTTAATGKEIDDINTTVLGTAKLRKLESGILINERKILKDVLTLNNANKLTIKGGAEGLTNAAFAAAKLGSNLKTVEKISESLLQFEDSITNEIQAELLLGKEFNFEIARSAALFGDLETVASEVNKQIGSAAKFSEMNVIQQSALAKTFGLQRDELADILVQQENLNKTRGAYVSLGEETIQQLKDTGKIEDAVFKRIKAGTATAGDYFKVLKDSESILEAKGQSLIQILGDESLASLQAQDAQSKFNDSLEKAKEIFSTLVGSGILDKLANSITDIVIGLSQGKGIINQLFNPFGEEINETDRLNYEKSQLEKKRSSTTDTNEQKQINAQIAEVDKKINAISENKVAKEVESNSGMNVLRGPKFAEGGIITKPIYNATIGEAGKEAVLPLNEFYSRIDNTKMVTLLEKLIATVEKGGNVYMDSTQVGRATVMANSKMG
jgi:hypothetical protein